MMTCGFSARAFSRTTSMSTRKCLPRPVGGDLVELAREVELHAVREVAAVGQLEAEDLVARGDQGGQHGGVGLAPECGCTLAYSAPNRALARSIASYSAMSTYSQPP